MVIKIRPLRRRRRRRRAEFFSGAFRTCKCIRGYARLLGGNKIFRTGHFMLFSCVRRARVGITFWYLYKTPYVVVSLQNSTRTAARTPITAYIYIRTSLQVKESQRKRGGGGRVERGHACKEYFPRVSFERLGLMADAREQPLELKTLMRV